LLCRAGKAPLGLADRDASTAFPKGICNDKVY
jgi:hypothetical protein